MAQTKVIPARQISAVRYLAKEKNDNEALGTSEANAVKVLDVVVTDVDAMFTPELYAISVGADNAAHWRVWVHDDAKARDDDIHWAKYDTVIDTKAGEGQAIDVHHMMWPRIRVMGWGDSAGVTGWARLLWRQGS